MPTPASAALRAAVHDALAADAALTALLGGAKIYDEPPRASASVLGLDSAPRWFLAELPDGAATPWDLAHARVAAQVPR